MIPCKECLMRPACQHKYYHDLLGLCDKLDEFLLIREVREELTNSSSRKQMRRHKKRFIEFYRLLKPTKWGNIREKSEGGYEFERFKDGKG